MTVAESVRMVISRYLGIPLDLLTPEQRLDTDLDIDSLERVEMAMDIEDCFHIEIPENDLAPLKSVGDVIAYVEGRVQRTVRGG